METKEKIDVQAMMETYKKLAIPGKDHELLASLEGSWTTRTRAWIGPDKPPIESTGTCEQKMLLGGRYLRQEYTGDMMGEKFSGINVVGYDNFTKKFVSTWIDSMSTGIYCFEGTASEDGKTITQEASYDDPVRGPLTWRSEARIVDNDTLEYKTFLTPKGGAEEKTMEMTLNRKK